MLWTAPPSASRCTTLRLGPSDREYLLLADSVAKGLLSLAANSDSVALRLATRETGDDGTAQSGSETTFLRVQSR